MPYLFFALGKLLVLGFNCESLLGGADFEHGHFALELSVRFSEVVEVSTHSAAFLSLLFDCHLVLRSSISQTTNLCSDEENVNLRVAWVA